jgi:glutamate formiminotransferase
VGARQFLIAYNVNLATSELRIAREIASVIRERGGGLKSVKAKGFMLHAKNVAQVSMNLTDFNVTGLLTAFNAVKAEAEKRGVQVLESELIGLMPMDALLQVAAQALQFPELKAEQVVEWKLTGI